MRAAYSLGNAIDEAIAETGWTLGEIIMDLVSKNADLTEATNNEWMEAVQAWTPDDTKNDAE